MKLSSADIGKKFRLKNWEPDRYIMLLAISYKGDLLTETEHGEGYTFLAFRDDWLPYEEQKPKKIKFAPALYTDTRKGIFKNMVFVSPMLFGSYENAKELYEENLVSWPAVQIVDDKPVDIWYEIDEKE